MESALTLLANIISLLVGGITNMAQGIGSGVSELVQGLFVTVGTNGAMTLTTFGTVSIIFAGISLAIGLGRWALQWVSSFGN